jgi:flagellin-like hook-associated protein FlgL
MERKSKEARTKLNEHRQKLMDSISTTAYNGVDIFEGVQPATSPAQTQGSIDLGPPGDAGVNIDSLMNNASQIWKAMNKQDIK